MEICISADIQNGQISADITVGLSHVHVALTTSATKNQVHTSCLHMQECNHPFLDKIFFYIYFLN